MGDDSFESRPSLLIEVTSDVPFGAWSAPVGAAMPDASDDIAPLVDGVSICEVAIWLDEPCG